MAITAASSSAFGRRVVYIPYLRSIEACKKPATNKLSRHVYAKLWYAPVVSSPIVIIRGAKDWSCLDPGTLKQRVSPIPGK